MDICSLKRNLCPELGSLSGWKTLMVLNMRFMVELVGCGNPEGLRPLFSEEIIMKSTIISILRTEALKYSVDPSNEYQELLIKRLLNSIADRLESNQSVPINHSLFAMKVIRFLRPDIKIADMVKVIKSSGAVKC